MARNEGERPISPPRPIESRIIKAPSLHVGPAGPAPTADKTSTVAPQWPAPRVPAAPLMLGKQQNDLLISQLQSQQHGPSHTTVIVGQPHSSFFFRLCVLIGGVGFTAGALAIIAGMVGWILRVCYVGRDRSRLGLTRVYRRSLLRLAVLGLDRNAIRVKMVFVPSFQRRIRP